MLLKLFQKTEEEGTRLNSFYEANTSNTKARQRPYWENKKTKKPYRRIFLMNTGVKFSTKHQQKNSNSTLKELYTMTKLNLYLECKEGSRHTTQLTDTPHKQKGQKS